SSRRRHTIFSLDWSSDVCSSDLLQGRPPAGVPGAPLRAEHAGAVPPPRLHLLRRRDGHHDRVLGNRGGGAMSTVEITRVEDIRSGDRVTLIWNRDNDTTVSGVVRTVDDCCRCLEVADRLVCLSRDLDTLAWHVAVDTSEE